MKTSFRRGELNEFIAGADRGRPTADEVCVATDGRRLDTPEKLLAFLDELNATRRDEPAT
ncbi:MAG: hypothetical protein QM733_15670 [Ilumatobacteraceae bacterium]